MAQRELKMTEDSSWVVEQGEKAFSEGRFDDAKQVFETVLAADPCNIRALNNLAVICQQSGDHTHAELLFLRAAALSQSPGSIFVNLSALALNASRMPEATGYLERALESDGETPRILEQMSVITECMGDAQTATSLWHKARQMADTPATTWYAAFEDIDITPDLSVEQPQLQGFFGPPRLAQRVETPLKMQILLLEDGYRQRALFVTADIFGFGPELVAAVRQEAETWGIPKEAVLLNASHTHYGPGTVTHAIPGLGRFEQAFAQQVYTHIAQALPRLYQAMRPSKISWSRCEAQVGFNRRKSVGNVIEMQPNPDGHYERETPILYVETDKGQRCLMVNHGCHPTGLGPAATISSDYPGVVRSALLDRDVTDVAMFMQGAAGNIKQGAQVGDRVGWIARPDDVHVLGHHLADSVAAALGQLSPIEGPLAAMIQPVSAPLKGTPIDGRVFESPENRTVPRPILDAWLGVAQSRYETSPSQFAFELSGLAIGPALFLTIPGEPMAETAHRIRAMADRHEVTFVGGYTNGLAAYFPADEMIAEGGYEAHMSAYIYSLPSGFDVGVESALLDGAYQCVRGVQPSVEYPVEAPRDLHQNEAFFVMSTGRSGTQTLAEVFKLATNAKVWHHPQPYMIKETQQAYWDQIDRRTIFWAGRGKIVRESWDQGLIHGETDHNMTPFCDRIAEDVPGSKFIISVRDPREFVRSGMRRNYFRGQGAWEDGRLRPHASDPRAGEWASREQFDQVCWLWAETYRHIERLRATIGADRVMVLKFEDLIAGPDATQRLFEFLGLEGFDADQVKKILGQKLNAQQVGEFPHPADWSSDMHARCWAEVGEVATVYGYCERYERRR
ncbi:MAG: sulfotransferase [Myxococcota bacterium]|nr:sulfotransferase [Myxococcota bacterium]